MEAEILLVLHGHLPYVRHLETERHLEESWFHEALFECYVPLVRELWALEAERVPFRVSLSVSPTLLALLCDPLMRRRSLDYLERRQILLEREEQRLSGRREFSPVLAFYRRWFRELRETWWGRWKGDLLAPLASLAKRGGLELLTTAATHAFLPLWEDHSPTVRAQLRQALRSHRRAFGASPVGFWLPECGYSPRLGAALAAEGIRATFVETHALLLARPFPPAGAFAPVRAEEGIVLFPRDPESVRQVWSDRVGYPGDPVYREFYRDAGFEADAEDLRDILPGGGERGFTGLKFYRVTGGGGDKEPYYPARAARRARIHARDFLNQRLAQARRVRSFLDGPPLFGAFFDAELFGHWWFEGCAFLGALFREAHRARLPLRFTTPAEGLQRLRKVARVSPALSSWGEGGFFSFWLDESNDWALPLLWGEVRRLSRLCGRLRGARGVRRRALAQAVREILLAQSSDWPFMLKSGRHGPYAAARIQDHLWAARRLADGAERGKVPRAFLRDREARWPIFPDLDPADFAERDAKSMTPSGRGGKNNQRKSSAV